MWSRCQPIFRAAALPRFATTTTAASTATRRAFSAQVVSKTPLQGEPGKPGAVEKIEKDDGTILCRNYMYDGEYEDLTENEQQQKDKLIRELRKKLGGPLMDEHGNVPTGDARPTAIEVDGPSHFYANSTKYTAYSKLKHRLLHRMGYRVLHVPYFEWRKLRGSKEREDYMRTKLHEQPSEWLDPEDQQYYEQCGKQFEAQTASHVPSSMFKGAPPPPPPVAPPQAHATA